VLIGVLGVEPAGLMNHRANAMAPWRPWPDAAARDPTAEPAALPAASGAGAGAGDRATAARPVAHRGHRPVPVGP